jgi:hypothetical protein
MGYLLHDKKRSWDEHRKALAKNLLCLVPDLAKHCMIPLAGCAQAFPCLGSDADQQLYELCINNSHRCQVWPARPSSAPRMQSFSFFCCVLSHQRGRKGLNPCCQPKCQTPSRLRVMVSLHKETGLFQAVLVLPRSIALESASSRSSFLHLAPPTLVLDGVLAQRKHLLPYPCLSLSPPV